MGRRYSSNTPLLFMVRGRTPSKFFYGFAMNALPAGTSSSAVLLLSMLAVALLQLPFVRLPAFFSAPLPARGMCPLPHGSWA